MNILIALDGSHNAEESIADLVHFPMTEATRVHLVAVCDSALLAPHRISRDQAETITKNACQQACQDFPRAKFTQAVLSGNAQAQLSQAARDLDADLILAGAHTPRKFPEQFLGSVATYLAKRAHCTVRLLRPGDNHNRFLVCLENSEIDRTVVNAVKEMSMPAGSTLMFFHVLDLKPAEFSENPHEDAKLYFHSQEEQTEKIALAITQYQEELKAVHPDLEIERMVQAHFEPAATILKEAKAWHAGSLVLGSHQRSAMEKFWLGTISEPVIASAPCTVHLVRHPKP